MIETINGAALKEMFILSANAVELKRQEINELNVFPVPDGDTGTNMSLTAQAAVKELKKCSPDTVGQAADIIAKALLRGARGNSGVILSLLFRGFAVGLRDKNAANGLDFANALSNGVQTAYKAVMKPAEGTMLTVSRVASEKAVLFAKENQAVEAVLEEAIKAANEALANTVNQNPVLLKAGVIDAGGYGFCIILEGMLRSLRGEKPQEVSETVEATRESADFTEYKTEDIKFAYCTEFIVERSNKKDASKLRAFLGSIGDSLVLVDDDEIIKVHVHTNHPGRAIEEGLKYGSLVTTKIENMKLQHEEKLFESEKPKGREIAAPEQKYGFIAVAAGDGLSELFGQLGTNHVIEGGQTMNPSTEDILGKIDKTPSEIVFVLPNNKNIIMAAEQCVGLSEKQVVVLPTKSIPEGVAAILAFDMTAELEENREEMLKAVSRVRTGQVTYAARNSDFDGHKINKGDYLALSGGKLLANGKNKNAIMKKLARDLNRDETSLVTIFYGEGVTEDEANEVSEIIKKEMKGVEVSVVYGGQPVYYYLISAE